MNKYYWHFVSDSGRLAYNLSSAKVAVGRTYSINESPVLCKWGFHAAELPSQALRYAKGLKLCLVTLGGEIVYGEDKVVAQSRTVHAIEDVYKDVAKVIVDDLKQRNENDLWFILRTIEEHEYTCKEDHFKFLKNDMRRCCIDNYADITDAETAFLLSILSDSPDVNRAAVYCMLNKTLHAKFDLVVYEKFYTKYPELMEEK